MKIRIERISRRMKYFMIFFFLCFCICYELEIQAEEMQLYAHSAVLMDGKTGRVLYGKEEDIARPMASTTKILTCIIALEECELEENVLISVNAQKQPAVHLGMKKGETYYIEDLLYSLMLESHNDSAVAIAEHISGSVEAFSKKMNLKAKEIGCENAFFVTPNGLDGEYKGKKHSISATDLAKIMSYCVLKSPARNLFCNITQTSTYQVKELHGNKVKTLYNHNALFQMVEGVISGKTGYTAEAGYCYVGAVERDNRVYVIALLGSGWPGNKHYKWVDSQKLLNYGFEIYHNLSVKVKCPKDTVSVIGGKDKEVQVGIKEKDFCVLVKEGEKPKVTYELVRALNAPVKKGTIVGKAIYKIENDTIKEFTIETKETVGKLRFIDVWKQVCKAWIVSCFL